MNNEESMEEMARKNRDLEEEMHDTKREGQVDKKT